MDFNEAYRDYYGEIKWLSKRVIRKFGLPYDLLEDFIQEGFMVIYNLLPTYDPTRGIAIKSYLMYSVNHRLFDFARHYNRQRVKSTSVNASSSNHSIAYIEDIDINAMHEFWIEDTSPEMLMLKIDRRLLIQAIMRLNRKQRRLIIAKYFTRYSLIQANKWGLTQSRLSQIHKKALRNLKKMLTGIKFNIKEENRNE